MTNNPLESQDYTTWLSEVKSRIQSARISAARSVNRELILLYWDIGRGIVQKQEKLGWGKSVVERLSADLKNEFTGMRGFSANNLWLMRQFFLAYSSSEFLEQLVQDLENTRPRPQNNSGKGSDRKRLTNRSAPALILEQFVQELLLLVPWGHQIEIIKKIKSPEARLYYLHATAQFGWTRKILLNQIKATSFEHSLAEGKTHNFPAALPTHLADQAEETIKSAYNLEFLGVQKEIKERELEHRLINRLKEFILELGYGFCFIERQHRLTLGKKEYFVDLLFYHRFLKCLIAIELKIGEFEPEFAGKMDFYLNVLNEKERGPDDNPSIGIILCAEKDDLEVEFSLKSKTNPIGVAEYQLQSTLPKQLRNKLPSHQQLSAALGLPQKKKKKK